jgi:predicted membrane protein (TIGR00267 family)
MFSLLRFMAFAVKRFREALTASPDAMFIARRLFVTNSIDSIISSLGVNVGAYNPGVDPKVLILAVLGGSISLSLISGFIGVFISEKAERVRELRDLERKLGARLENTIYARSATLVPLYVALWSSTGMLLFPLVIVAPYTAVLAGIMGLAEAFSASIAIALLSLAVIGAYLGIVMGERMWLSALRTLGLGIVTLAVVVVFKLVFGALVG